MRYIIIIFLLGGCLSQKKVVHYLNENHQISADYCAEKFPVKDSIYVKDTVVLYDTLQLQGVVVYDTLSVKGEPVIIERACPPTKVITKTVRVDSVITRRDIAQETSLRLTIKRLSLSNELLLSERDSFKGKATTRGLYLWGLIALLGLWILRKPLLGVVKKLLLPI